MMIEINIIYGLILAILTLVLSGGFLFSKRESRDEVVLSQYSDNILYVSRNTSVIPEGISPDLELFLGFKLTIKRRQFLKALFLDFSPCHK